MRIILIGLLVSGCGLNVKVRDSSHDVNVSDSEQTITIKTTLDKILEICGVVKPDGTVVKYKDWTDEQKECFETLNVEYGNESSIDPSDYVDSLNSDSSNR